MSVIKKYWTENVEITKLGSGSTYSKCPRIECADGFTMSVQAGEGLYSTPRSYIESGDYSSFEIGFPSEREDLIMEYIDGDEETDPTDTVYGYVPIDAVDAVIEKHGGIAQ